MADEYFDLVDVENRPLGISKPRRLVHRDGDWHRAVHVWVLDREGRVLLQRRSATKDLHPDTWAVSVGGHVDAGSDYLATAVKETGEELGLAIDTADLAVLMDFVAEERYGELIDREHMRAYRYTLPVGLEALRPDPEEVAELRFFSWDELAALWEQDREKCSPSLGYWQQVRALL